jgi:hypothetical protein
MYIDKELEMDEGNALVRAAGTYYSYNWIDLGPDGNKLVGQEPYLMVRVGEAFATGTSVAFELVSASTKPTDTTGAGIAGEKVELSSGVILTASLTKDTYVFKARLPEKISGRYLGMKYTAAGASAFTTGTIDAFLTPQAQV